DRVARTADTDSQDRFPHFCIEARTRTDRRRGDAKPVHPFLVRACQAPAARRSTPAGEGKTAPRTGGGADPFAPDEATRIGLRPALPVLAIARIARHMGQTSGAILLARDEATRSSGSTR